MLSRSPTIARMLGAFRCLDRQKWLAAPSQRMIFFELKTKQSSSIWETSELRTTRASTSREGSRAHPMDERSMVTSCQVAWNMIIIWLIGQKILDISSTYATLRLPSLSHSYERSNWRYTARLGHQWRKNWDFIIIKLLYNSQEFQPVLKRYQQQSPYPISRGNLDLTISKDAKLKNQQYISLNHNYDNYEFITPHQIIELSTPLFWKDEPNSSSTSICSILTLTLRILEKLIQPNAQGA